MLTGLHTKEKVKEMKRLYDIYMAQFIGHVDNDRLNKILLNEDEDIHVKKCMNGMIVLDNNKIIRCIDQYYNRPKDVPENSSFRTSKNKLLRCENVRKNYGLDTIGSMDCIQCHRICLQRAAAGRISRQRKARVK